VLSLIKKLNTTTLLQVKEIVFLKRKLKSIFGGWDLKKVEIRNSCEFIGGGGIWQLNSFFVVEEKKAEIFLIKCPFFRSKMMS
jgi:hypothetical protein